MLDIFFSEAGGRNDTPTLEPSSRHRHGRVGALRGRHRATTYQTSQRHLPRDRAAPHSRDYDDYDYD
eukprot:6556163-Prymnesium_polylepis.1